MKRFEDLNHSLLTPEVTAQETSKIALMNVGENLTILLNHLEDKGYIRSYKIEINPFNSGYQLIVEADMDVAKLYRMEDNGEVDYQTLEYVNYISHLRLQFQPESFFNDRIEEKNAEINYSIIRTDSKQREFMDEKVKYLSDIDEIAGKYVKHSITRINVIFNHLR